jgi:tetratricopeptide (TPR) repeat protein
VYLLGHEELQVAATDYLGGRLEGYRGRLHAWAAGWRALGWPAASPEYLLTGYFRLLEELGDLSRMTELAGDKARRDRMMDLTGGDAAAVVETRAVLDRIAAQDEPDLTSALTLACHRDHLTDRNAAIPPSLPAVWAVLGQLARAEALARSIPDRRRQFGWTTTQGSALAEIVAALAHAGRYDEAEAMAQSIPDGDASSRASGMASLALALARAGRHRDADAITVQAVDIVHSIDEEPQFVDFSPLVQVAETLALAGEYERAKGLARSIRGSCRKTALIRIAETLAEAGQYQEAEAIAHSLADPGCLALVADALSRAGQRERGLALATEAEGLAWSIADLAGQGAALAKVAGAVFEAGQHQRGLVLVTEAEAKLRSSGEFAFEGGLVGIAEVLALAGRYREAESMARSITDPYAQGNARRHIAVALAEAGHFDEAEAVARSINTSVAEGLAKAGWHEEAMLIARSVTEPYARARILACAAEALARTGQRQRASAIAVEVEAEVAAHPINPFSESYLPGIKRH